MSAGALRLLLQRQEALRLSFLPGRDGPVQMIRSEGITKFRFRELTPAQGDPEAVEEIAREVFHEPFDLLQGPLPLLCVLCGSSFSQFISQLPSTMSRRHQSTNAYPREAGRAACNSLARSPARFGGNRFRR